MRYIASFFCTKNNRFITSIISLLLVNLLFAQQKVTLYGTVKDQQGNVIEGVSVSIKNSMRGTVTDNRGRYALHCRKGKQLVVVSMLGYATIEQDIEVKKGVVFDFVLQEDYQSLGSVEVYGKNTISQVRSKGFSVSALDISALSGSIINLNSFVGKTSGIRLREEGGLGSDFKLSINGLSGNTIRYFIDGVPLASLGSGISLANLPVNLVDRVEIYKGVVPAELGEDALGGAINIITKKHKHNYINASLSLGSFHTYIGDLSAQIVCGKYDFTIRPTLSWHSSANDYIMRGVEVWNPDLYEYQTTEKRRFHDSYKSLLAGLKMGFTHRPWADEFMIGISSNINHKELQTGQKQTIVIGTATKNKTSFSISGQYTKRHFYTDNLAVKLYASYTTNHSRLVDTAYRRYSWDGSWMPTTYSEVLGRARAIRHYLRPQILLRGNINYAFSDHSSLNINYLMNSIGNRRYDDYDLNFVPSNDRLTKHIVGLSYNQQFWHDRLNTNIFVKNYIVSYHQNQQRDTMAWLTGANKVPSRATKNYYGYGVCGRYTVWIPLSIKSSYERSVRMPIAREFLGNSQTIYPNFQLKPETSHNINVGLYGSATNNKHLFGYDVGIFVRKVTDYIFLTFNGTNPNGTDSQYRNIESATISGVEMELVYEFDNRLKFSTNATVINERNRRKYLSDGTADVTFDNRIPNKPWLYGNVYVEYLLPNPLGVKKSFLRLNTSMQFVNWFYLTWEAYGSKESKSIIPTQISNDISATWSFADDRYSISMECTNFFNSILYDNYMLQKPGRGFCGKFKLFIN
ncbi:MAG: TonB-dependent receptor [Bacteroidales bacterium]|nr:MAG: TonB-dependent receptor [Bacteroidales bacterium]